MEEVLKKAYSLSLKYLQHRMRTKWEMTNYLRRHMFSEDIIAQCIALLCQHRYVDDQEYCKTYVEYGKSRLKSIRQVYNELMQRGIDRHIISQYLVDYPEEEIILKLLSKRSLSKNNDRRRLTAYLLNRGFQYETVKKVLDGVNLT